MRKRTFLVMAFIMFVLALLHADITATYSPQSYLVFKLGPDISTTLTPSNTFASNKLVAHIGTLEITAVDEGLMRPYLVPTGFDRPYMFRGQFNTWGGGIHDTEFYVYAYTSLSSSPFPLWLENGSEALAGYSNTVIGVNPFVVDFFFVSHHDAQYYEPGELYELVGGTLGGFNVTKLGYNDKGKWIHVYIPVNNQELPEDGSPPVEPIPIIGNVLGAPIPSIPYGDNPPQILYDLSIVDVASFSLEQAYSGNPPVPIAICQLTLQNANGTDNAVQITFTSSLSLSSFYLHHADSSIMHVIPYTLYFLGEPVIGGEPISWESLGNGLNEEAISVGNINPLHAESAPEGPYSDTIIVEVESTL